MFTDNNLSAYLSQLEKIARANIPYISSMKPSEWVEKNLMMGKPFPGPFRYDRTPYTREIIDCLSPDHPARKVAVMKGAQIGFSSGVIIPGTVWIIRNNPGNTVISVGAPDLIKKAMAKLDSAIDNTGSRNYIKPQAQRRKMQKSGDTNEEKEFIGGYVGIFSAGNHKAIRQVDLQTGFFDDLESIKQSSKESGDTVDLLDMRFAAYADSHKIFYVSTPELKQKSNIEPLFLKGDQRYYNVPCPCCHEYIDLKWSVKIDDKNTGGIVWEKDNHGNVISSTVGYVCQRCAGFFTDKGKYKMLNDGLWVPTAVPVKDTFYSYRINSLYAPIGMFGWAEYAAKWVEAVPDNQPRNEKKYQTFVNTVLAETYEMQAEQPNASSIQKNIRPYEIGTIPEKLSKSDGNGRIVLITCAADMNGKVEDARLDYEIVAWSENNTSYSIEHGSIGTFIPREGSKKITDDRQKWTYEFGKPNNVWDEFDKIGNRMYEVQQADGGTRRMGIMRTGLDCGYFSNNYAYPYIDSKPKFPYVSVIGLKGKGDDDFRPFDKDTKLFMPAKERPNLFILTVGLAKDEIAENMQLNWNERNDIEQPSGFMNYPTPSGGKYGYTNYFEHYESEERVIEANPDGKSVAALWKKKTSTSQNHFFDCRVYNIAVKNIIVDEFRKELKVPKLTWAEFAAVITGGK